MQHCKLRILENNMNTIWLTVFVFVFVVELNSGINYQVRLLPRSSNFSVCLVWIPCGVDNIRLKLVYLSVVSADLLLNLTIYVQYMVSQKR